MGNSSKKDRIKFLNFTISLIALLAPGAYLIGSYYYHGKIDGFGVDSNAFPISTPDVYIFFYNASSYLLGEIGIKIVSLLKTLIEPPGLWVTLSLYIIIILMVYCSLKLTKSAKNQKIGIFNKKIAKYIFTKLDYLNPRKNDLVKAITITSAVAYSILLLIYFTISVILFWLILPKFSYEKGYNTSLKQIEEYDKNECLFSEKTKWNNCVELKMKNKSYIKGLLVAISDNNIAIYANNNSFIVNSKDVEQIKYYKKTQQSH